MALILVRDLYRGGVFAFDDASFAGLLPSDAEIKVAYENNADTNAFTDAEKTKLNSLDDLFKGEYVSLGALQTAHPTSIIGAFANVDTGVGVDVDRYIWDDDDFVWVRQLGLSDLAGAHFPVFKVFGDSPYTAVIDQAVFYDVSGGDSIVELPTAVGKAGKTIIVKRAVDTVVNSLTIDPFLAETVDGKADIVFNNPQMALTLMSDGVNWRIV